jgi:hypothetical protein
MELSLSCLRVPKRRDHNKRKKKPRLVLSKRGFVFLYLKKIRFIPTFKG